MRETLRVKQVTVLALGMLKLMNRESLSTWETGEVARRPHQASGDVF
jgi:hypothetical protein